MSLTRTESLPRPTQTGSLGFTLPVKRYDSLGGRRLPSLNTTQQHLVSKLSFISPRVPMELLLQIIHEYANIILAPALQGAPHVDSQKMAFKRYFAPLTLVCRGFRFMVLPEFFRAVAFSTTEDSSGMLKFLDLLDQTYFDNGWTGGYIWVRLLKSPSFLVSTNIKFLKNLIYLRELQIDFANSGLTLQRSCIKQLFNGFDNTYDTVHNLTSLKLMELPRIDDFMLTLIAKGLPNLVDAEFISTDGLDMDCCPNCYEDSLSRINHSLVPELYHDVISLSNTFGLALAPLTKLKRVFFGVFLSPSSLLDIHITHATHASEMKPTTVETIFNCPRCAKYEASTKKRELLASLLLAHHLTSLESVGWSSVFGTPCSTADKKNTDDTTSSTNENEDNAKDTELNALESKGNRAKDISAYEHFSLGPNLGGEDKQPHRPSSCACSGHGLKTMLLIRRNRGTIGISRALGGHSTSWV